MNIERINKLKETITREAEKGGFNMDIWLENIECQTVACIAGWTVSLFDERNDGFLVLYLSRTTELLDMPRELVKTLCHESRWPADLRIKDPKERTPQREAKNACILLDRMMNHFGDYTYRDSVSREDIHDKIHP
jgi:hypothetical protein